MSRSTSSFQCFREIWLAEIVRICGVGALRVTARLIDGDWRGRSPRGCIRLRSFLCMHLAYVVGFFFFFLSFLTNGYYRWLMSNEPLKQPIRWGSAAVPETDGVVGPDSN